MKTILLLAASIGLCAGSAIPLTAGDNSHYVEGESRYIWMPDGEGKPILVDLYAQGHAVTRPGQDNEYWLYTRSNINIPQVIDFGNVDSIFRSNFDVKKPLMVLVHGWNNHGNSPVNEYIRQAALDSQDINVLVVDWNNLSNQFYLSAVQGVPSIGREIANFIQWLLDNTNGSLENVHLVGHSLGAHVMGNAGRHLNGRVKRITGLDPAGPLWSGNSNAISATDGQLVEIIHTDIGLLGITGECGDADFYPNGGRNQPGCLLSTCSHSRAYQFFAASLKYDNFLGYSCNSLNDAISGSCSGSTLLMGNNNMSKTGAGIFYLTSTMNYPYY